MYFRIFDCWRFAAALLVMAYHFLFFAPEGDAIAGTAFLYRLLPLLDMFFMISGFLIAARYRERIETPRDYLLFLRRRVARLYPLHLITLTFFVLIALAGATGLVHLTEPRRWEFGALPLQLLGLHAWGTTNYLAFNYPSWSVSAEIFCYLFFPVILLAARRGGWKGVLALLGAYVLLVELLSSRGVFPSGHWTSADTLGAYRAFADFTAGALAALLVRQRWPNVRSHVPGLACLALAIVVMLVQGPVHMTLVMLFLAILAIGASETARPHSTDVLRPLMALTRVSFGVYLWHPVMETLFLSILWKRIVEPTGAVSFYSFWVLPMVATLAVALLSDRFLEKRLGRLFAGPKPETEVSEGVPHLAKA